ncbi:MAG: mercuric reductase, partial [Litorilinea sp.]
MVGQSRTQDFDAVIIGAGQAGGPLATALAQGGQRVALVERAYVGGSCINVGCTPTKTMVASARVAHVARRAADYGVHTGTIRVDLAEVRRRKREMVESFRSGSRNAIEGTDGVELIMGEAAFAEQNGDGQGFLLDVAQQDGTQTQLGAGKVFINTGARNRLPTLPGLETTEYLDNASIMELDTVPDHLLVLGGGYIGLEFGQMFRRFGSQVTIVQRGSRLLNREDADISDAVAEILREDGVRVLLDTDASAVEQASGGEVRLRVSTPDGDETLVGSHLLVATGRIPNSEHLQLDRVGVATDDRGNIQVNGQLETNVPGIYAVGDVKGGPAFTHISYDDFRVLRTNLLEGGAASIQNRLVPYTVFIDPELGRVGLGEEEARQRGLNIRVAKMPMAHVARALETDETRGFMKAVVDADTQQILGCAILGIRGGEIATVLQVAMLGKLPYTAIRDGVFSHPTVAESLNN